MVDDPKADSEPMTWAALRDASTAVQLAVQMLAGPLAPWSDPPPDPTRLRNVLRTLEGSTRRITALVAALQPARAVATAPWPVVVVPAVITSTPVAAPLQAVPPQPIALTQPAARERRRTPPRAVQPSPPTVACTHVPTLLRDVEIALLTGPGAPRVAMHVDNDLHVACAAALLAPSLIAMVQDAAAMGPGDAVVEVRAFADLADALGDDMDVVFEVRPDPRVPHGHAFRPGALGLPDGARLEVHGQGSRPRACVRVAATRPARILAA